MPREKTPEHLLLPGDLSQQVVANSERIRKELGYKELFSGDVALRRTIAWERAIPSAGASLHQFDYESEDRAIQAMA